MATTYTELSDLYTLDLELVHNDPMQDVQLILDAIQQVLTSWHSNGGQGPTTITVFTCPVVYTSANQRRAAWARYFDRNPQLLANYSEQV